MVKSELSPVRAIVIHPVYRHENDEHESTPYRRPSGRLQEAVGLVAAINLEVVWSAVVMLSRRVPATYIGRGKIDELAEMARAEDVSVIMIDTQISPIQQRNLEIALQCKVIDRTALILEIFGERARTKEGRLQVELASQEYQKSRLVRSWTHLERQRGGAGFMGGPGEKQIESDRRAIADRITIIKRQLQKVVRTRSLHRAARRKIPYPIVALVGYTNAGKSTLFNHLTKANVFAEDLLFATLDPTMRMVTLPSGAEVILSDTVGFISDLPAELVAAFRATLEEVCEADILLHVRDMADPDTRSHKHDVEKVLTSLVSEDVMDKQLIEVYNKHDQMDAEKQKHMEDKANRRRNAVTISAVTGYGVNALLNTIDTLLKSDYRSLCLTLDATEGKIIAWVHEHGEVLEESWRDGKNRLTVAMSQQQLGRLSKIMGVEMYDNTH